MICKKKFKFTLIKRTNKQHKNSFRKEKYRLEQKNNKR